MIINLLEDETQFNFWNPYVFKFKTNAKTFKININIIDKTIGYYPHLGVTAREGILIMFRLKGDKNWYNFDAYARKSNIDINMTHIIKDNSEYEVLIYGPLLSKLSKLDIEISDQYYIHKLPTRSDRKILIVGGIQSFGIGCTTVGVKFSNILSRDFETEIYHLTFNNNNYLDKIYKVISENDFLPKSNICILELDYFNQNDELVEDYLLYTIEHVKKYCENILCWFSIPKEKEYKKKKIYEMLKNYIETGEIILKDFSYLYGESYSDICTYNLEFINDTGNILIYKELRKYIMETIKWNI